MLTINAILMFLYALMFRKRKSAMPEDYNNQSLTSPRARQLRMSMNMAMLRERIKDQRIEDVKKSEAASKKLAKSKPQKKGTRRQPWSRFLENTRKVKDEFTEAFKIKQRKKFDREQLKNN